MLRNLFDIIVYCILKLPFGQLAADVVPSAVELRHLLVQSLQVDVFARSWQRGVRQRSSGTFYQASAVLRVIVHLVDLDLLLAHCYLHTEEVFVHLQ
jgi:hypothetical protein